MSVFPASGLDTRTKPPGPTLMAANGSTIPTFGTRELSLHFAANTYRWKFLLATVARPLLGADFLRAHGLLVDLKGNRLVDATSFVSIPLVPITSTSPATHLATLSLSSVNTYNTLLAEFPEITTPNFTRTPPRHGVEQMGLQSMPDPAAFRQINLL